MPPFWGISAAIPPPTALPKPPCAVGAANLPTNDVLFELLRQQAELHGLNGTQTIVTQTAPKPSPGGPPRELSTIVTSEHEQLLAERSRIKMAQCSLCGDKMQELSLALHMAYFCRRTNEIGGKAALPSIGYGANLEAQFPPWRGDGDGEHGNSSSSTTKGIRAGVGAATADSTGSRKKDASGSGSSGNGATITRSGVAGAGRKAKRSHQCPVCLKTMSGCSSPHCPREPCWHLNRHLRTVHHGIRDYRCSECGTLFGQKGNAVKHIKVHHDDVGTVVSAAFNGPFRRFPTKKEERQYERRAALSRDAAKGSNALSQSAEAVRIDSERQAVTPAQYSQPQPSHYVNAHNSPQARTIVSTSAAQLDTRGQTETRGHTTAKQQLGGGTIVEQNERDGETLWGAGEEVEVLAFANPSGAKRQGSAHVRTLQPEQKRTRQHRQM